MNKKLLAIIVLALAALSCGQYVTPTPATPSLNETLTPSQTGTPLAVSEAHAELATTSTPDRFQNTVVLAAFLNVRVSPDGPRTGLALRQGDVVRADCVGSWCELESGGFVWRGCTDDNPESLGCSER